MIGTGEEEVVNLDNLADGLSEIRPVKRKKEPVKMKAGVMILLIIAILILLVATLYMFERNWFKHYIFYIKDFKKKDIILEVLFISIMLLSLVFLNTNLSSPFHYFKY